MPRSWCSEVHHRNQHFLNLPSGPLFTGEGLCHVEFLAAPGDAQNWFVGSAGVKNAFHQRRVRGWLQAYLALPAVLASVVGRTGKVIDKKRLAPDSLIYPVPQLLGDVLLSGCHGPCTLAGSADSPLFICRDHSAPPLFGGKHGLPTILEFLPAPTAARFISGVKKVGLDFHDICLR